MSTTEPVTENDLRDRLTMTTASGRTVPVLAPKAEHIDIADIARGLAMQCRYAGQIRSFYSVAEHSVLCAEVAQRHGYAWQIQLACLLHDAAEAYVGDIIWPVKAAMRRRAVPRFAEVPSDFDMLEEGFLNAIAIRFGLARGFDGCREVKDIDQAVCAREMTDLRTMPVGWKPHVPPADIEVHGWSPNGAEIAFLQRAEELGIVFIVEAPAIESKAEIAARDRAVREVARG